jgi:ornithine cyclodeaminase
MITLFYNDIIKIVKAVTLPRFFHGLVEQLEKDFAHWSDFNIQPRLASHHPDGVIELMPTNTASRFAFKYVNGHPINAEKNNKLSIIGFGALADAATGLPLVLTEMTILTALRTAATSVVAAKHLANKNPKSMAIIGTGAQSEFQALAFHHCLQVNRIKYFDKDPNAMLKFQHNLSSSDLQLQAGSSIEDTINDCDIITTATAAKKKSQLLSACQIQPGTLLNSIGGDCPGKTELNPDILDISCIVVDFLEQAKIEGEIQNAKPNTEILELQDIITGKKTARKTAQDIILFDSVGCAVEDYSALEYIYKLANELNIGQKDCFLPEPSDPKDLFSLLK